MKFTTYFYKRKCYAKNFPGHREVIWSALFTQIRFRLLEMPQEMNFKKSIGYWCLCIWKGLQIISITEQLALLKAWIWHQQSCLLLKNANLNHGGCTWIWNKLSCVLLKNANLNHGWHHSGCTGPQPCNGVRAPPQLYAWSWKEALSNLWQMGDDVKRN